MRRNAKFMSLFLLVVLLGNVVQVLGISAAAAAGAESMEGGEALPAPVIDEELDDSTKLELDLDLDVPDLLEALTGPVTVTGSVYFLDGAYEPLPMDRVQLVSSDENVLKVTGDQLYPMKPGKVTLTAIYENAEWTREITVTPSAVEAEATLTSLSHDPGYVLANTGEGISLKDLEFEAVMSDSSTATLMGSDLTWSTEDSEVVADGGELMALSQGVHFVIGQKDDVTVTILIVAKGGDDAEYVIYENDFDAEAEGTLPTDWSRIEGTSADKAAVKSGALEIDASSSPDNPSRVLLPEYLNLFGDYKIEADVTHLSANEATRWHSIMYRIQNNNYPYYQMAVRQNATAPNGVEFAERTSANAWNVMNKSAFSEPIDAGQMYHYTIQTQGNRVREFINDELLIDTDNGGSYLKGGIGLQANGSKMKVDNLRIALQLKELPPRPEDRFVQVSKADTEIAMAPSIITEFSSKQQLENMDHGELPATVIMHVDARLRVKTSDRRTSMISLEDALDAIGNRMMPAFYVNDRQTVDALVPYLKSMGLEDAFVVSDQADLVARAREGYPMLRGIMDFSKERVGTTGDLMRIRKKTTLAQSKIAILPQAEATIEHVSYLQQRTIVVWVKEDTTKHRNEQYVSLHQMITSGANGIVTTSPSEAFRALKVYSHTRTLIRKPLIIGHRGMPSVAPENTIISNELALDVGADFIENDIFLSKDGYLVIIHDSTVDSSTNGSGRVEEFTLEQLRQLQVNQVPGTYYPEARIATLEEQIDLARKRRAMIYAEIKTDNPAAVDAFVKLVKKKRAEDLINVMSFNTSQLDRLAEQLPDMPLGLLTSGYANENNVNSGLRDALKTVQTYNSTLNISYGGLGEKFMEAAHHRGLLISPWTYNNLSDYKGVFLRGAFGITTDYAYWSKDWVYSVQPEKAEYVLEVGKSMEVSANVESYNRARTAVKPSIVLLKDDGIVSVEGNRITGNKAGRTYALLRYTAVIDEENQYDVYTEPVLLVVKKGRGK